MNPPKAFSISERLKSFKPAIDGLKWFLANEHNVRVHIFLSFCAVTSGLYLHISNNEWVAICICIGLVISLEAANSAIEKLVDLVSPEKNQLAGLVKDLAAAAVLVASITSLAVAIIIFFPKLFVLF